MSDYISDGDVIYVNDDETVRVRVVLDESPHEPEFDGAMPTLRVDSDGYDSTVDEVYGSSDYGFDADDAWRRFNVNYTTRETVKVFERYVRIFHGCRSFHTYNLGISREYGYVTFDTAHWREAIGLTDEYLAKVYVDVSAESSFAEYKAWIEGECYGLILEYKVEEITDRRTYLTGEWTRGSRTDVWDEVDAIWGVYGDDKDNALDVARGNFNI